MGYFTGRYRDKVNMAISHIGVTASLSQHADFFRYLLLKCVDRWNVYSTHSLSLPYSLVYSVRILSP
nr:MAG TPA: hypothetical protein [Caudoviricetes sp.]